jgi:hypothetical protein
MLHRGVKGVANCSLLGSSILRISVVSRYRGLAPRYPCKLLHSFSPSNQMVLIVFDSTAIHVCLVC